MLPMSESRSGSLRISSLLFADVVTLLGLFSSDLQLSLGPFAVLSVVGVRISNYKCEALVLRQKRVNCLLQVKD